MSQSLLLRLSVCLHCPGPGIQIFNVVVVGWLVEDDETQHLLAITPVVIFSVRFSIQKGALVMILYRVVS